jgi:hypothetical protein
LKNQDTHIRWDYRKTDDFVHILSNDDTLQHIDGQLSDIDKNTITTDQLNGLVRDSFAFIFIVFLFAPDFTLLYESLAILN